MGTAFLGPSPQRMLELSHPHQEARGGVMGALPSCGLSKVLEGKGGGEPCRGSRGWAAIPTAPCVDQDLEQVTQAS